jgi:hypothetical protein
MSRPAVVVAGRECERLVHAQSWGLPGSERSASLRLNGGMPVCESIEARTVCALWLPFHLT